MVARVLGKLLHMVGILSTNKVTEVQRTDLVGEFVGHTGPKTRRKAYGDSSFQDCKRASEEAIDLVIKNLQAKIYLDSEPIEARAEAVVLLKQLNFPADVVVPITCFLIICLFALQHYGTHRVGFLFAPIIVTWLLCISTLGIYNIVKWNPLIYQKLSPSYMFKFLKKTRKGGWMSLGGILLCMTGSEAMFADLGHFSFRAIQEGQAVSVDMEVEGIINAANGLQVLPVAAETEMLDKH